MIHASLFSGIGGPEVAAAMLGWENAFHCEINPFGRAVLEYWFPNSESYEDITKTSFRKWRGRIDVITGGFPCQPFSYAGRRGGQTITVTSGQKCSALLTKSGPLGSLVKMLLDSPLWSKEGYSLTWDAIPLCSERVTDFTDTNCDSASPLNASAQTLRVLDTPSSRCLFRLRLSALPIGETESSLLPMLQTPTVVMTCESPESFRARAERKGYKNGTQYGSLESQVNYDPRFKGLLKTPSEFDGFVVSPKANPIPGDSGCLAQEIMLGYAEKRGLMLPTPTAGEAEKYRLQYTPGSQMGTSLSAMGASGLLPTPTARDEKNPSSPDGNRLKRKLAQGYTIELNDLAAMGNLPTPSSRDWKGKTNPGIVKEGSGCIYGETLPDTIGRLTENSDLPKDGPSFRLSPLFTEEMMGFPFLWTTLPFLQQSGGPNLSRPTETP